MRLQWEPEPATGGYTARSEIQCDRVPYTYRIRPAGRFWSLAHSDAQLIIGQPERFGVLEGLGVAKMVAQEIEDAVVALEDVREGETD